MFFLPLILCILAPSRGEGHPTPDGGKDSTVPIHVDPGNPSGPASHVHGGTRVETPSSCNYTWPSILVPAGPVQACHDLLAGLDAADCSVPAPSSPQAESPDGTHAIPTYGNRVFCGRDNASADAIVMGVTFKAAGTISACRDVARGLQWILDMCDVEGQVAGQAPAWGNGDLLVVVQQGTYLNLTA